MRGPNKRSQWKSGVSGRKCELAVVRPVTGHAAKLPSRREELKAPVQWPLSGDGTSPTAGLEKNLQRPVMAYCVEKLDV